MGLIRVIFELLVLYLVYKLIFDFIIPVYRTTRQVNQKMGEMQNKMNDQFNQPAGSRGQSAGSGGQPHTKTTAEKPTRPAKEDYIEFEELK